MFKVIIVSRLL